jgi:Tfp pilus assembly protein PilV
LEKAGRKGQDGFSVLEIFIALLILFMGVIGLAMVQMTALSSRNPLASSKVRVATDLAQAALDRFERIPWDEMRSSPAEGFRQGPEGTSPEFSRLADAAGDSVTVQGTSYIRIWKVTQDAEISGLRTIYVWCCWLQGEGQWRQVALVTQRAYADR